MRGNHSWQLAGMRRRNNATWRFHVWAGRHSTEKAGCVALFATYISGCRMTRAMEESRGTTLRKAAWHNDNVSPESV
jgi:hypothetical protein